MLSNDSPRDSLEMGLMFLHITKAAKKSTGFQEHSATDVRCQTQRILQGVGKRSKSYNFTKNKNSFMKL